MSTLLIPVLIPVLLWILYAVLKDFSASPVVCTTVGVVCGLLLGAAVPGLLVSELSVHWMCRFWHDLALVARAPFVCIQAITELLAEYNAGDVSRWRLICAVSYYIVPGLVGAVLGGLGGYLLADGRLNGWKMMGWIVAGILAIALCSFLGFVLVGLIDLVTRKEFWVEVSTVVIMIAVFAAFFGGGTVIVIGVANS